MNAHPTGAQLRANKIYKKAQRAETRMLKTGKSASFKFEGIKITINPGDTYSDIRDKLDKALGPAK